MAKALSQGFLGKQIDGIWHTGTVVYGKEYYYGGGICSDHPSQTPFGSPQQVIEMGETEIPQEVFLQYLQDLSPQFTPETYHLLTNNCNNFTDKCVEFLVGKNIPKFITGLPEEALNTPMGMMLKPFIEQMETSIKNQEGQHQVFAHQQYAPQTFPQPTQNQTQTQTQTQNKTQTQQPASQQQPKPNTSTQVPPAAQQQPNPINLSWVPKPAQVPEEHIDMKKVIEITDMETLFAVLDQVKACIIDFSASWCGPCKMIKPKFIEFSEEYPDIMFYTIDGSVHKDISSQYNVTAFPTFVTILENNIVQKWAGANQIKLKEQLDRLNQELQKLPKK